MYATRILQSLFALGAAFSFIACKAQQPGSLSASGPEALTVRTSLNDRLDKANDDITSSRQNAITRAVARVSPAVVGINVTEVREVRYRDPMFDDDFFNNDPYFQQYFGKRRGGSFKQEVRGLGSGFLISNDGYIVTNDHVAGRASKVIVTMTDGKQYNAKIIGSDRTSDIALLKIDGQNLPFIELGNSDEVIVGEWAIALGNPFGLFDINTKPTVTVGVISNTGVGLGEQEGRVYKDMLQTDAAISSGNSGGPLVNGLGLAVGVNATIYSTARNGMGAGSIGIGFSIPINRVKKIVEQLKKNGSIDRDFYIGMRVQQIDANIARYLKLPSAEGVVIAEIDPSSPAGTAGLQIGDVLVAINGETVKTENNAVALLSDARFGDTLKITVMRDGKRVDKSLNLTAKNQAK